METVIWNKTSAVGKSEMPEEEMILLVGGAKVSKTLIIGISERHNVPVEVIISACNGMLAPSLHDKMLEMAEAFGSSMVNMEISPRPEYHEAPGRSYHMSKNRRVGKYR